MPNCQPDKDQVEAELIHVLGRPIRISMRTVPTILPEPGGKYRFVKNCTSTAGRLL
jgi:hypothetical protein